MLTMSEFMTILLCFTGGYFIADLCITLWEIFSRKGRCGHRCCGDCKCTECHKC